jgi:hypothetical protein
MKTLNIYCGIRSIGWNVTDAGEVIDFGVKRVNVDFDSYYAFIAGLPVAKRIDRRMKRQARRNMWRWKTRREKLTKLLKSDGMYPVKYRNVDRAWLNTARSYACFEKVEPEYLGRVLMDIQSKRGYKSMRGVDDTGDSEYLKTIAEHEAELKNFPTVGDYLASLPTSKNVILRRETYEAEFYRICKVQGIDPERYYGAIFMQRPLKKGKIAFCRLEANRKVTHQSNPMYQKFRILRDAANIEIFDAENNEVEITAAHRMAFIRQLQSGKDLTKAGALKIMGIKKSANYTWYSGKAISGDIWGKLSITNYELRDVWQDLIAATDDNLLIEILKRKYRFSHEKAVELAGYDIKGLGYSDYSMKAIDKLLPELQSGKTLNEAILNVYGKVDFGGGTHLRNVVLEQVHASAASLIEALKKKYEIGELQIEIDSLLKMGNKARKARASGNRKQEKETAELDKRIAEAGAQATDYNRKKLKLWDEMKGCCPYFPDREIPLPELFTEDYNLDHIVPKSKLFEFSDDNLVLCPTGENLKKLRTPGADFAVSNGTYEQYIKFVNEAKISEKKKSLLLMKEEDIPTDYLSRKAGSDYNTRCFLALNDNSRCIPNKLINMYTKRWYKNAYDENDVRNVLVKAFTMANMDGDTIAYFDRLKENSKYTPSAGVYDLKAEIALPDLSNITVFCPKTKFFRRTKYGYITRFSLHKESVYGQRKRTYRDAKGNIKEEVYYKIRQPLTKLTPKMAQNISDLAIRKIVLERYDKGKEFAASIAEKPLYFNGKPIHSVSVNVNGSMLTPLHSAADGCTGKFSKHEKKVDFVYNSMNYCMQIIDGKKVCVSLLEELKGLNENHFLHKGFHKGDSVMYEGKQYFISGLGEDKIALRSVYTLIAENALNLSKASEIEKLEKTKIAQV